MTLSSARYCEIIVKCHELSDKETKSAYRLNSTAEQPLKCLGGLFWAQC